MPIKLEFGIDTDTRPELNTDKSKSRYYIPSIVRINFIDEKSGRIMFTFVPTLDHEAEISDAFKLLREYDERRKDLANFIIRNQLKKDNRIVTLKGCVKAGDVQKHGFIEANKLAVAKQ